MHASSSTRQPLALLQRATSVTFDGLAASSLQVVKCLHHHLCDAAARDRRGAGPGHDTRGHERFQPALHLGRARADRHGHQHGDSRQRFLAYITGEEFGLLPTDQTVTFYPTGTGTVSVASRHSLLFANVIGLRRDRSTLHSGAPFQVLLSPNAGRTCSGLGVRGAGFEPDTKPE